MRRYCSVNRFRTALLFGLIFLPAVLDAQSIWTEHQPGRSLTIEYMRPNYSEPSSSYGSFILFFTGRFPAWERTHFIVDLPIAYESWESNIQFRGDSNLTVGNPYLGVEILGADSTSFAEIGFRLPIATDDSFWGARTVGILTDYDRQEAFYSDLFMVSVMGNHLVDLPFDRSFLRIRFGPNFWFGYGSIQLQFDYSLQGGYRLDRFTITTGFSGRFHASGYGGGDLAERTVHQFGVAGSMNIGRFQPGLYMRIPIDQHLSESTDYVLGLNVGIAFN